jgi:hypothetical protein
MMTIDKVQEQNYQPAEKPPITVQNEIQKDIVKETTGAESPQKQLLQVLASQQPQEQIQQTAKDQLDKGHLDVKV